MIGKVGTEAGALWNRTQSKNEIDGTPYGPISADKAAQREAGEINPSGVREKKTQNAGDCETCKNRRYQDGSNDPGVSFKTPTKLSPTQAASAVFSHEREHYTREDAKAKEEGREVLSNTIRVFTAVCPECGTPYVSGGETRTVTRKKEEQAPFAKQFFEATVGPYKQGKQMDVKG